MLTSLFTRSAGTFDFSHICSSSPSTPALITKFLRVVIETQLREMMQINYWACAESGDLGDPTVTRAETLYVFPNVVFHLGASALDMITPVLHPNSPKD